MARTSTILWIALAVAFHAHGEDAEPGPGPRPPLLHRLDGDWVMTGDVQGQAVTYALVAGPVLGGSFTELHMKDVAEPPQYEARVFIGHEPAGDAVIVHWLDSFGARYSVPPGSGHIENDVIVFTVPYADGPFRDTLRFASERDGWDFRIEAQQPDGSWTQFARYEIRRR